MTVGFRPRRRALPAGRTTGGAGERRRSRKLVTNAYGNAAGRTKPSTRDGADIAGVLAPTPGPMHPCGAVLRLLLLLTLLVFTRADGVGPLRSSLELDAVRAVGAMHAEASVVRVLEAPGATLATDQGCEPSDPSDEPDGSRGDEWVCLAPALFGVLRTWTDGACESARWITELALARPGAWRERARGPPAGLPAIA